MNTNISTNVPDGTEQAIVPDGTRKTAIGPAKEDAARQRLASLVRKTRADAIACWSLAWSARYARDRLSLTPEMFIPERLKEADAAAVAYLAAAISDSNDAVFLELGTLRQYGPYADPDANSRIPRGRVAELMPTCALSRAARCWQDAREHIKCLLSAIRNNVELVVQCVDYAEGWQDYLPACDD